MQFLVKIRMISTYKMPAVSTLRQRSFFRIPVCKLYDSVNQDFMINIFLSVLSNSIDSPASLDIPGNNIGGTVLWKTGYTENKIRISEENFI